MSRVRDWAGRAKLRAGLLIIVAGFLLIQLVPYGRDHANPAGYARRRLRRPATEQLADDACGDCHSNLTSWPIESNIAPTSWLIQHDVEDGRKTLNFSEWDRAPDRTSVSWPA